MITKKRRLAIIQELVNMHSPSSQHKLLKLLHDRGFTITQTTLSRDIKQLKISKIPDEKGNYMYATPQQDNNYPNLSIIKNRIPPPLNRGFVSFEFSYQLGVIKTRQGYASDIASDVNIHASSVISGAIPGNDIVLLIPREGVSKEAVVDELTKIIPGFSAERKEITT